MSQIVLPPDVALWATQYLRSHLTDMPRLQIDVSEPPDWDGSTPLAVLTDIPGSCASRVTWDWTLAVTVRMGTRQDTKPCRDLAARIMGLLTADPQVQTAAGSPICEIVDDSTTGPSLVTEDHDTARYYLTVDYTVYGHIQ